MSIMKRIILSLTTILLILSTFCYASQLKKITLSELQEKADLVVLAKVVKIEQDGNQDNVTVKID